MTLRLPTESDIFCIWSGRHQAIDCYVTLGNKLLRDREGRGGGGVFTELSGTSLAKIAGFNKWDLMWDHLHFHLCFKGYSPTKYYTSLQTTMLMWSSPSGMTWSKYHTKNTPLSTKNKSSMRHSPLSSSTLGYYYNFNDLPRIFHALCCF